MDLFWRLFSRLSELLGFGRKGALRAELIEGTELDLEWTEARVIRGNRVRVGPGCIAELVEYTEHVQIDPEAVVKEVKRAGD
ncbi:hypothetical protein [Paenibacillus sp.]|uniref:hypothetical protein n=1 Tax=Paenibacillus sp. TaxID=58172 RepID=UPI002D59E74E|nr:hypothetical protein [Paenibacillus sp.]HZG57183.1 hypothetical protein [Paenibacillus sp.]